MIGERRVPAAYLAPAALLGAALALGCAEARRAATQAPPGPNAWGVESVIIWGPGGECVRYPLGPPLRVIRNGEPVLSRRPTPAEAASWPVVRVDLTADGQQFTVFARAGPELHAED